MSRANELREALDGPKGALDGYLELYGEAEIKAHIKALIGDTSAKRENFAAMAMQGLLAHGNDKPYQIVEAAVLIADALIAELSKGETK
jgi:hypothetical protein